MTEMAGLPRGLFAGRRHRRQWWMLLIVAAFLWCPAAGCTVGPDYERPTVAVPEAWGESAGTETRPADLTAWWQRFNSPTLNDLIEQALRSNLDLRVAAARVRQARGQRVVAAAPLWPTLGSSADYERSGTGPVEQSLYQAGFDASWEIDVFGGVRRGVEAAGADVAAAEEDHRDVLVTLLAEVAVTYLDLRGTQQRIEIARNNLASQRRTLQLARDLLEAGKGTQLAVSQAEAQVAATESTIPPLETVARLAVHQLAVLLGHEPMALSASLTPSAPLPVAPPEVPMGLPSDVLRNRPDVRRAERQLAAATARVGVAVADLFPRFYLVGALSREGSRPSALRSPGSQLWSVGPTVSWPIFEGGAIAGNIDVQRALMSQAAITYRQTVLTALREAEDALAAYLNEKEHNRALARSVDANRQALQLATDLYTYGQTSFLDVLLAQQSLLVAEDALVQSDLALATDVVALYKALGAGWQ